MQLDKLLACKDLYNLRLLTFQGNPSVWYHWFLYTDVNVYTTYEKCDVTGLKNKRAASHKVKRFAVQLPLDHALASRSRTLYWHLETISRVFSYDVLTFKSMKGNTKRWNVCVHVHSFYGGLGEWKEILLMLLVCVGNSFVCKCLPVGCLCATYEMFTCGVFVCYL